MLSVIILTIAFYLGIKGDKQDRILIKEDQTLKMTQNGAQYVSHQPKKNTKRPTEGLSFFIGKDVSELEKVLGQPQRIDETLYGYQWHIYNKDYQHYVQVGVENNRVVTIFALGERLNIFPFKIGQPIEEIFKKHFIDTNISIEKDGNSYRFELNDTDLNLRPVVQLGDIYSQLYIDKFTGTLSSVRFINADTLIKQRPYELIYRGELIESEVPSDEMWKEIEKGTEQQISEITNVIRQRFKLKPLIWDEKTAEVAYGHSKDMAESNDFSHQSQKYGSLTDRLNNADITYKNAGENIAANYIDAPAAIEGWLNSKEHRGVLLNKDFSHIGVGVYKKYYTQNFIQKTD
ncbi:membrane protein [Bacillus sp. X1(2014)]|nr:membrane protein [Bacillus sp. X1(2014)]